MTRAGWTAWATVVLASVLVAGCEPGDVPAPGRDAGRGDGSGDATMPAPPDGDSPATDAAPLLGPDVVARAAGRPEICGNGVDDDDNGLIDDGCDCAVGTTRACWPGPPDMERVGACHDGTQACRSSGATATWGACEGATVPTREVLANGVDDDCDGMVDEPDGICVPTSQNESGTDCTDGRDDDCDTLSDCDDPGCAGSGRCPPACRPRETVCWGGADEDCDGARDCADSDCAADPSCAPGLCPQGQVPTYRERDLGHATGGSSITAGDGRAIMPLTCETGTCSQGQVAVVLLGQPSICVPPPPPCTTPGQSPTYVSRGTWRCDGPCDLVIQYGSLFGGRRVCAQRPMLSCASGQVPTFVQDTQSWQCRPTCSNTTYDRIMVAGLLVCVPC